MTASRFFLKPNCKSLLVKNRPNRSSKTDSNSLDKTDDNVIPRYMSNWEASPGLHFNNGTIMPLQNSIGTNECLVIALNNKQICTARQSPPYKIPVKCPSVSHYVVNIFKTLRLRDRWADVDEPWHIYSMGVRTRSRKRNFEFRPLRRGGRGVGAPHT